MDNMDIFGKPADNSVIEYSAQEYDAHAEVLGDLKILRALSSSSSDGELLKWQVISKKGEIWWLKSSSIMNGEEMYECESECIACRIARKLKMENVVAYDMDTLEIGNKKWKVCISPDFVEDGEITTFAEIVPEAVQLHGQEKYECVCEKLPDYIHQLNQILVFDAIIFNKDRHLNNLALVNEEMVLFDNGASMFSRDTSAKLAYKGSTFNYQSCKPFYSTVKNQLALVTDALLDRISMSDIKFIVERFLDKRRSKWVLKLLDRNLMEVERFWK